MGLVSKARAERAAGNSAIADNMLLPLAVRMAQRGVTERFIHRSGLRLYLLLLREHRQYGAALALLNDDAGLSLYKHMQLHVLYACVCSFVFIFKGKLF